MTQFTHPSLAAQPLTLRQHMHHYLDHLEALNRSPATIGSYRERLLPFVAWCGAPYR